MADWKTGLLTRLVIIESSTVLSEASLMSKLGSLTSDNPIIYTVYDFHLKNIE